MCVLRSCSRSHHRGPIVNESMDNLVWILRVLLGAEAAQVTCNTLKLFSVHWRLLTEIGRTAGDPSGDRIGPGSQLAPF